MKRLKQQWQQIVTGCRTAWEIFCKGAKTVCRKILKETKKFFMGESSSVPYRVLGTLALIATIVAIPISLRPEKEAETVIGEDGAVALNLEIANNNHEAAMQYMKQGDYDKAIENFLLALEEQQKTLGPGHIDTVSTRNNLGIAYLKRGDQQAALDCFNHALPAICDSYGEDSLEAASLYNNIALALLEENDFEQARVNCEKALAINRENMSRGIMRRRFL